MPTGQWMQLKGFLAAVNPQLRDPERLELIIVS